MREHESEVKKLKQQLLSTEDKLREEVAARRKDALSDMQKSRKQVAEIAQEKDDALVSPRTGVVPVSRIDNAEQYYLL